MSQLAFKTCDAIPSYFSSLFKWLLQYLQNEINGFRKKGNESWKLSKITDHSKCVSTGGLSSNEYRGSIENPEKFWCWGLGAISVESFNKRVATFRFHFSKIRKVIMLMFSGPGGRVLGPQNQLFMDSDTPHCFPKSTIIQKVRLGILGSWTSKVSEKTRAEQSLRSSL